MKTIMFGILKTSGLDFNECIKPFHFPNKEKKSKSHFKGPISVSFCVTYEMNHMQQYIKILKRLEIITDAFELIGYELRLQDKKKQQQSDYKIDKVVIITYPG